MSTDQSQDFVQWMKNQPQSTGMAPNGIAKPGEEYGQFVRDILGAEECHQRALRGDIIYWSELLAKAMHTLKTPNATVRYTPTFTQIVIEPTTGLQGPQPLDIMDVKEIYAAFFRGWLIQRIEHMKPDDVIKLGYYVAEKYPE